MHRHQLRTSEDFRALKEQKKSPTLLGSTSHFKMLPGTDSCCTGTTIRQLPASARDKAGRL
jgi:hypothetical protein